MRIIVCLWIASSTFAGDRYLDAARRFVDTMIEHGTDRYGVERSPLFAAMLDLETLRLPVEQVPPEFYRSRNRQVQSVGFGLPPMPTGVRPGDRAPFGNNIEHDFSLLRAMYQLSVLLDDKRYEQHADEYLAFWLNHCQSPETGLMASGEHNSWDFVRERAHSDVHEVFRPFPFWDKLYAIDPYRALRIAEGLWMSQIADKATGDFNRHAGYRIHRPAKGAATGAAFPRHAAFYIWAFANAYVVSRDPKFIERIEVLIESRTALRLQPWSLLVHPGDFRPAEAFDPALRILLWKASELVPARREAWRNAVRVLDGRAFVRASPTSRADLWHMAYGKATASSAALESLTQYRQQQNPRFLHEATAIADLYVAAGWPTDTAQLWPRAAAQVISLMAALSSEAGVPLEKQKTYRKFAVEVADKSIALFACHGLFRAEGAARHYEAITGADDLVYSLIQLQCEISCPEHRMGHIDINL